MALKITRESLVNPVPIEQAVYGDVVRDEDGSILLIVDESWLPVKRDVKVYGGVREDGIACLTLFADVGSDAPNFSLCIFPRETPVTILQAELKL